MRGQHALEHRLCRQPVVKLQITPRLGKRRTPRQNQACHHHTQKIDSSPQILTIVKKAYPGKREGDIADIEPDAQNPETTENTEITEKAFFIFGDFGVFGGLQRFLF